MVDNQSDFHSEEFERSLEAGIHQLQTIFVSFKRTSQATAVPPDHDQLQDQHSRQSAVQAAHSGEITDQHSENFFFRPPPTNHTERQPASKKPPVWRGGDHSFQGHPPNNGFGTSQRERGRATPGADRPPVPPRSSSIDRMHRIGRDSPEPGFVGSLYLRLLSTQRAFQTKHLPSYRKSCSKRHLFTILNLIMQSQVKGIYEIGWVLQTTATNNLAQPTSYHIFLMKQVWPKLARPLRYSAAAPFI